MKELCQLYLNLIQKQSVLILILSSFTRLCSWLAYLCFVDCVIWSSARECSCLGDNNWRFENVSVDSFEGSKAKETKTKLVNIKIIKPHVIQAVWEVKAFASTPPPLLLRKDGSKKVSQSILNSPFSPFHPWAAQTSLLFLLLLPLPGKENMRSHKLFSTNLHLTIKVFQISN